MKKEENQSIEETQESSEELSEQDKILEILKIGDIAKIKGREDQDFYYVKGLSDEYLVILPNFCTCEQFVIRSLTTSGQVCKHILSVQATKKLKPAIDLDWMKLLLKDH
ncbi:MAG: hypothetical protein GPJ54_10810 [Candidatus Heimdallarchaeota archaeon]|nr:hypothetical protein [Candidatus Heimdallarchaeota archaeon]